jgi:hypothetical protein
MRRTVSAAIPLGAAGVLALVAILAIVTVPDLKVGFSSTRFEMLAVGVPAILGAVLAALASLIQTKRAVDVPSAP